jgi:VanZ family protein
MSGPGSQPSSPLLLRSGTWAAAWLLWLTVLTILSSLSQPGPKIDVIGFDKIVHTVFFALGGSLLAATLALRGNPTVESLREIRWGKLGVVVLLAEATVGWLDEWHQSYTPGRSGLDVYDWLADLTGSALAVPLVRPVLRRLVARVERA